MISSGVFENRMFAKCVSHSTIPDSAQFCGCEKEPLMIE